MQIMRVVLGETCTRFRPGADGGRDGWFQGVVAGILANQRNLSGAFVLQCKHTSHAKAPLIVSDLAKEMEKLKQLTAKDRCHYILMTNRQVTAKAEESIRTAIEAIPGVDSCLLLGETWIEDEIDAHSRLLRLVPRLYGIGDLSQIVSFVLQEQTRAVLDDLATPLRTFVPTGSYRRAETALEERGFVVLVGPPASGKSAIAATLCLVSIAQNADVRVLRIEHADQFTDTFSPADVNTIYWVDDVFGETTLDEANLRRWAAAFDKVEAARKRGARIVFCTRDYILAAARRKLKSSKADFIGDARVVVEVSTLLLEEKERILYNHVKDGDITREQKRALKKYLPTLAGLQSFSPELARRLGSNRFNRVLRYDLYELRAFFDKPVPHIRDVIHGLSDSEKAALWACLNSGNALVHPVADDAVGDAVLQAYDVSIQDIRNSLAALEGSIVKRVRHGTSQTWQLHHPSMLEALQEELADQPERLALYLQSADLQAVLRDTTTEASTDESRLIFVSDAAYQYLVPRLVGANCQDIERVAAYLATRASSALLHELDNADPALIDKALSVVPEPEGAEVAANFAVRLRQEPTLFSERRQRLVEDALREGAQTSGWCGFLEVDGLEGALPGFQTAFLKEEQDRSFESTTKIYDWYSQDISSTDDVDFALSAIEVHCSLLQAALKRTGAFTETTVNRLNAVKGRIITRLLEKRSQIEEDEEERAVYMSDNWRDYYSEARHDLENNLFADVDE